MYRGLKLKVRLIPITNIFDRKCTYSKDTKNHNVEKIEKARDEKEIWKVVNQVLKPKEKNSVETSGSRARN